MTTVATVAQTKNGPDFRDSRKIKNLNDYKGPDPLHSISKLGRVLSQASCSKITISNIFSESYSSCSCMLCSDLLGLGCLIDEVDKATEVETARVGEGHLAGATG